MSKKEINDLWYPSTIGQYARLCENCGIVKPIKLFKVSNVCRLCRKLLEKGIRHTHRLKLEPATIYGGDNYECVSCNDTLDISEFTKNSLECDSCETLRNKTELAFHGVIKNNSESILCKKCLTMKSLDQYPLGRLTCIVCILRENRKGVPVDKLNKYFNR